MNKSNHQYYHSIPSTITSLTIFDKLFNLSFINKPTEPIDIFNNIFFLIFEQYLCNFMIILFVFNLNKNLFISLMQIHIFYDLLLFEYLTKSLYCLIFILFQIF